MPLEIRYATLSHREREVMTHVVSGLLNEQIAGEPQTSEITVKAHRGKVMRNQRPLGNSSASPAPSACAPWDTAVA